MNDFKKIISINKNKAFIPSSELKVGNRWGYEGVNKIKITELIGIILDKKVVQNDTGKYASKYYINLTVNLQNPKFTHITRMFVSPEKINNPQIIEDIINNKWVDKKYVFKATNTSKWNSFNFWLVDWEEVEESKFEQLKKEATSRVHEEISNQSKNPQPLSDNLTLLELSKQEVCQAISFYQKEFKLTDEAVAKQMELTLPETEDILCYRFDCFTLDRLLTYANKLFKTQPIKIKVVRA